MFYPFVKLIKHMKKSEENYIDTSQLVKQNASY